MDILFVGRLACLTGAAAEALCGGGHKVVYASDDVSAAVSGKNISPFRIPASGAELGRVFNSYNLGIAVFFAQGLHRREPYYGEYEELENLLRLCAEHEVNQVLYIQPGHHRPAAGERREHDLAVMLEACDGLCSYYRRERGISVIRLNVPSIFGYGESYSVIGDAVMQARSESSVHFFGAPEQRCSFVSERDLGELLLRICENWTLVYDDMDVTPVSTMTFSELGGLIKREFPTARLSYTAYPIGTDVSYDPTAVRREYDWVPTETVSDALPRLIAESGEHVAAEKRTLRTRLREFVSRHSFVVQLLEVVLGFLAAELLVRVTGSTEQFRYIDFRLLYIVVLGTVHGMRVGLAAAALASVSLLSAVVSGHAKWEAVAFDIDTWLPYIFFFLVGAVTGYVHDKLRAENTFLRREQEVLEDKYITLNEFYVSALSNKDKYRTQIMSYRDSFGRLFDVAKKLDSTTVEHVFLEALHALEGVLDNRSICIYRCDARMNYARLVICSKEVFPITEKSLELGRLDRMLPELGDGNVWVNRERLPGYPEYAMVLYHDDKPIALITVKRAAYDQFSIYYENLIKIICGLIKISLIRAIEYNSKTETEKYIPGSHILKNEYFGELIRNKEEMAQSGTSEYLLLHIDTSAENRTDIANTITGLVRNTDELGLGKDGELYLCLSQTNASNVGYVLDRLKSKGLHYTTA